MLMEDGTHVSHDHVERLVPIGWLPVLPNQLGDASDAGDEDYGRRERLVGGTFHHVEKERFGGKVVVGLVALLLGFGLHWFTLHTLAYVCLSVKKFLTSDTGWSRLRAYSGVSISTVLAENPEGPSSNTERVLP